jgi:cytochrome bd ubiquinol oxidase subunit I
MGIIGTRSLDRKIPGIEQIVAEDEKRIRAGIRAYDALEKLKANRSDVAARAAFDDVDDPRRATEQQIKDAAWSTVPNIPSLFFAFRLMVLCAFVLLAVFAISLWHTAREAHVPRWLMHLAVLVLPLPWIAVELGWFVAEFGRQPWIIDGVLPTFLATSELGVWNLLITILGFTLVYGVLAAIEVRLMLAAIRKGPEVAGILDDMATQALLHAEFELHPAE